MKRAKSWCLSAFAAALVASSMAVPASAAPTVIDTRESYYSRNVRERVSTKTNSTVWVKLYGTTITIPAAIEKSVVRARFTAESLCESLAVPGICSVRVLFNGVELEPASGLDYAFDSTDNGTESTNSMEGHALERTSYSYYPPGMYPVEVQISVDNAAVNFTVDDWHFVLELLRF
jgi:hypothetical protein